MLSFFLILDQATYENLKTSPQKQHKPKRYYFVLLITSNICSCFTQRGKTNSSSQLYTVQRVWMICRLFQFSLVEYTLKTRLSEVIYRPAKRVEFLSHAETVFWTWSAHTDVLGHCSKWLELQHGSFICRVIWLFSAWPGHHIPRRLTLPERFKQIIYWCEKTGKE